MADLGGTLGEAHPDLCCSMSKVLNSHLKKSEKNTLDCKHWSTKFEDHDIDEEALQSGLAFAQCLKEMILL